MTFLRDRNLQTRIFEDELALVDELVGQHSTLLDQIAERDLVSRLDQVVASMAHRATDLLITAFL